MKIALAQINPAVGDLEENYRKICVEIDKARVKKVNLIIFPELCITGYPPKDLLLKKSFISANLEFLHKIVGYSQNISIIIGFVDRLDNGLYNAAAIIENGKLLKVYHKIHLPNYDVFDEKRYFQAGKSADLIQLHGKSIGVNICEDIWIDNGPADEQCMLGADLIVNISASPFHAGKASQRERLLQRRARDHNTPIIYLNLVGAQDDLLFDGRSYFLNQDGKVLIKAKTFEEDFIVIDDTNLPAPIQPEENVVEDIYYGLVLGVRDYFRKNGFTKAIIGLSGGIDSALTAVIAVAALGKDNVIGITMPSKFSSVGSVEDSRILAENIGIKMEIVPIKPLYDGYIQSLDPLFTGTSFNVAEENIQARIRGNILMAMSNKFGHLVLATGNKSELSVGYATLYGDMAGGLAVISDIFKTTVYELCHYINQMRSKEIIPKTIIDKAPSAELRDNQKDSDSLPEYPVLDPILKAYVEEEKSKEEIIALGFNAAIVERVMKMVDRNEYKRQQAALGFRITPRAFGYGRRMPITNGWKG